jgi:sugar/nucleoside kinase (ribokinase family)
MVDGLLDEKADDRGTRPTMRNSKLKRPLGRRFPREVSAVGVDTALVELNRDAPTGVYFKDPGPEGTRVFYYRWAGAKRTLHSGSAGASELFASLAGA